MKRFLLLTVAGIIAGSFMAPPAEAARLALRSRGANRPTPHYLLQKSDPRRFNGPNYFVHPPFKK
jgi:hypothetical protein